MKIICVGRNYAEHAAELGDEPPAEPLLFGKFENTLIGPGEPIVLPPEATHVDAEAELAVEIGVGGRRIAEAEALSHVRGYRCANDVSARNIQYGESQWTRARASTRSARSATGSSRCRSSATARGCASSSG